MERVFPVILYSIFGILLLWVALKNEERFFNARKVKQMVTIIGLETTRIVYGTVGVLLLGSALSMVFVLVTDHVSL